ncbi:hypothetical protein M8J76_015452 [Diaphorina citri]|nr:hypothetical protein M8J76_015452 [Diaphorina citri]
MTITSSSCCLSLFQHPLEVTRCGQVDESITSFEIKHTKITKPEDTKRGQFPWQVSLYRKRKTDGDQFLDQFCGGSIITRQHVLTAAHCFKDKDYTFNLHIGDFDRKAMEDKEEVFPFSDRDIYMHKEYNSFNDENDIAVVKIRGTITFGMYAQPICLPAQTLAYRDKYDCLISGWGRTWDNDLASNALTLKAARVGTLSQESCRKEDAYGTRIKDSMFCAGSFQGGADSCQGDSGGPIVCDIQDEFNKHYLIQLGIVSFGIGCGKINKPGVYTKLMNYQGWLEQTLTDSVKNIGGVVQKKVGG